MTRHDDFSTEPRKWSPKKLNAERKNGMPAVLAEYERGSTKHSITMPKRQS